MYQLKMFHLQKTKKSTQIGLSKMGMGGVTGLHNWKVHWWCRLWALLNQRFRWYHQESILSRSLCSAFCGLVFTYQLQMIALLLFQDFTLWEWGGGTAWSTPDHMPLYFIVQAVKGPKKGFFYTVSVFQKPWHIDIQLSLTLILLNEHL